MGSRYLPALFVRHKETSGDAVVTSPTGCGELPRERFGARGLWWPLRSDRVHPACFLAGRRSIQQWGRHLACGPAVLPIFCRAPLVPGPGKFREDQCPTELGRRAACQRRRQRTSRPALRPPQSGPIPWASGAGLCSLPSPASGKRGRGGKAFTLEAPSLLLLLELVQGSARERISALSGGASVGPSARI